MGDHAPVPPFLAPALNPSAGTAACDHVGILHLMCNARPGRDWCIILADFLPANGQRPTGMKHVNHEKETPQDAWLLGHDSISGNQAMKVRLGDFALQVVAQTFAT